MPSADPRLDDAVARHALTVRAAARTMSPHAVVSHVSAAALHGLDAVERRRWTGSTSPGTAAPAAGAPRCCTCTPAGLDVDEIVEVDGIAVTSVPRTLADLARTLPFEQALVVADAALHRHRATPAAFEEAVARAAGREGSPPARRVVAAADPRAGEPGGDTQPGGDRAGRLPPPVLQHDVPELGAVTDFYWEEFRTVGEFDGKVKYGRSLRPGEDPGEAVYREKRREDALRDLGLQVVRWTWDELCPFDAPAERLRRAFARLMTPGVRTRSAVSHTPAGPSQPARQVRRSDTGCDGAARGVTAGAASMRGPRACGARAGSMRHAVRRRVPARR